MERELFELDPTPEEKPTPDPDHPGDEIDNDLTDEDEQILQEVWEDLQERLFWYRLKRRGESRRVEHLPGQHDQKTHGRRKKAKPEPKPEPRGGISEVEAEGLFYRVGKSGGFSYQPIDDTSPKTGYAVSTFPQYETALDYETLTENDIYEYLIEHRELFDDPNVYAGGWHDTEAGKVYLDISTIVDSQEKATTLAREHNQEGIYDLGQGQTIIVKEQAERRL